MSFVRFYNIFIIQKGLVIFIVHLFKCNVLGEAKVIVVVVSDVVESERKTRP